MSDAPRPVRAIGTRAQVWHGLAHHTTGGLTRSALKMNKAGRIVSKKASERAQSEKRLQKAGFTTRKGEFKLFPKKR